MKTDFSRLEHAIDNGNADLCVDFLINCREEERKCAWSIVKGKLAEYQKVMRSNWSDDQAEQERCNKIIWNSLDVLPLAILATGTLAYMKKLGELCDPFARKPVQVLRLVKAIEIPWLGHLLEYLAESGRDTTYEYLVSGGYVSEPKNEGYITGLFGYLGPLGLNQRIDDLRTNRHFLDNWVWRLLEVEGFRSKSLAGADSYSGTNESWAFVLKTLSQEGKLDRKRLMACSLAALAKDFQPYHAGWFSRFHEFMQPTLQERLDYEADYLNLLTSSVPLTVNFALNALKIIDTKRGLTSQSIDPFQNALLSKQKATVLSALGLIGSLVKRYPFLGKQAVRLVVDATPLSDFVEVQERMAKFIESQSVNIDEVTQQKLSDTLGLLKPSAAKIIERILAPRNRGMHVPEKVEGSDDPQFIDQPVSQLAQSQRIIPISDPDELLEKASYVLENLLDIEETERVLAGLLYLCDTDQAGLSRPGQALLKKAREISSSILSNRFKAVLARDSHGFVAGCIMAWLGDRTFNIQWDFNAHFDLMRLSGIFRLLKARRAMQLISTPTLRPFWIDPLAFVERIKSWQSHGLVPDDFDLVVGFLRLVSENRSEALASAADLTGELGASVRYALGGTEAIGETPFLWVAASRARFGSDCDEALKNKYPGLGPGSNGCPKVETMVIERPSSKLKTLNSFVEPGLPDRVPPQMLPVALFHIDYFQERINKPYEAFASFAGLTFASFWPGWREPIFLHGAHALSSYTAVKDQGAHQIYPLIQLMTDPHEPFGPWARLLLNLGLSDSQSDGRAVASDAFISGINTGRLNPVHLGKTVQPYFNSGLFYPARIRKSLENVINVSRKHKRAVLEYLHQLFQGDSAQAPDQLMKLLELYHELLLDLSEVVRDEDVLTYLRTYPGGGRGGKLAKQILALK